MYYVVLTRISLKCLLNQSISVIFISWLCCYSTVTKFDFIAHYGDASVALNTIVTVTEVVESIYFVLYLEAEYSHNGFQP